MRRDNAVHTYLDPATVRDIDQAAEGEGITRSAFVRRLVINEMTRRSRAAQGLPEHIEDPTVLARVASLIEDGTP
jgi:hypothetical protein